MKLVRQEFERCTFTDKGRKAIAEMQHKVKQEKVIH